MAIADHVAGECHEYKSFLVLFFKKEHTFFAAALAAACISVTAHATSAETAGLYVYLTPVPPPNKAWEAIYDYALKQDYVDGAAIMLDWDKVEPTKDIYDWSSLDTIIDRTVVLGKKLSIGVIAGSRSPQWLYKIGVKDIFFQSYDRSPPTGLCTVLHQPEVWDPLYLAQYDNMMTVLADHLKGLRIPGKPPGAAYNALRVAKLSGINLTTEELRINAHPAGGPCHEPDSAGIWAEAGYRPDKILSAWMTIAKATAKAFPDKVVSVAIIHKGGFPQIDDDGHVGTQAPVAPDPMMVRILEAAVPKFGSRLMVQWNALSQFARPDGQAVLPHEVIEAGEHGALIGWQLNGFLGVWGGSGCIYRPFRIEPCHALGDFEAIMDNGMNHGGRYMEIHPVDVDGRYLRLPEGAIKDYAPAFEAAHRKLMHQ